MDAKQAGQAPGNPAPGNPGNPQKDAAPRTAKPIKTLTSVVIRFAGDSGDGMQLAGMQFTDTSAVLGNDLSTFPDYPSEIRAPTGTVAGVSGYQIQISSRDIFTPGDDVDALIAMNPAALKSNYKSVKRSGIIIVNEDSFTESDLKKAGYTVNPLEDGTLANYRLIRVPIDLLNAQAVAQAGITGKQADLCKNFFALGLIYWLYDRPLESTINFIRKKFGKKNPSVALADEMTLKAGYNYGETVELFDQQYHIDKANLPKGTYRRITGNEAAALGLMTAAHLAGKDLVYPSYPITPATDILHELAIHKNHRVVTFQAEDEICAMGAAIGAAFAGAIAVTGTSGPGIALKSEAMGLAVITELPVVIIDVQRGGPSTGLPTKTEQSDLFQTMYGRNGECPIPIIAAASPADCFNAALEACRIAVKYMTPVVMLSDGYVANSSEPWLIPDVSKLEPIVASHPTQSNNPTGTYKPYVRNEELVRDWAIAGTPGLEHRIGGLEKQDQAGTVSYDPVNHEVMTNLRAAKVAGIKPVGLPYLWTGEKTGDVLLLGWGGTYGAIKAAALELQQQGVSVSHCHLRSINPFPTDLGDILKSFKKIVIPELNLGQLQMIIQAKYVVKTHGIHKVRGQPFTISELTKSVLDILSGKTGRKSEASVSDAELAAVATLAGGQDWKTNSDKNPDLEASDSSCSEG